MIGKGDAASGFGHKADEGAPEAQICGQATPSGDRYWEEGLLSVRQPPRFVLCQEDLCSLSWKVVQSTNAREACGTVGEAYFTSLVQRASPIIYSSAY